MNFVLEPARRAEHVFIVSFDGGKPWVMQQSRMPHLERLRTEGAFTWEARTVFPSITLVSHTSMLTGALPTHHKITWNDWKPEKGAVPVPTVFTFAKKTKRRTALFAGKEKFAHLYLPGTVDAFAIPGYKAKVVAATAAAHIQASKPHLCFIHFADPDGAGHDHGWGSPQQIQAMADADQALGVVLDAIAAAGLNGKSTVIVSADHGGHAKTHGTAADEDTEIPWIAWGAGIRRGLALTQPISTCDTAATALTLLGVPFWGMDGKPVTEALLL